jgi:hypothetical protein
LNKKRGKVPQILILDDEENDEHLCTFYDEDDCRYQFVYSETVEKNGISSFQVTAQKLGICPTKADILTIVTGVVGTTILLGLAILLLWKLLTTIHDRREFVKFQKESQMADWNRVNIEEARLTLFRQDHLTALFRIQEMFNYFTTIFLLQIFGLN